MENNKVEEDLKKENDFLKKEVTFFQNIQSLKDDGVFRQQILIALDKIAQSIADKNE